MFKNEEHDCVSTGPNTSLGGNNCEPISSFKYEQADIQTTLKTEQNKNIQENED